MTAYTIYFNGLKENYYIAESYRHWTPQYCVARGYPANHVYTKYGKHAGKTFNLFRIVSDKIKESVNDTFVFINTVSQERDFDNFLDKYELKDLIVYQMPYYVTNHNHIQGRNLRVTVLASKEHFWRDWYSDETENSDEIEEDKVGRYEEAKEDKEMTIPRDNTTFTVKLAEPIIHQRYIPQYTINALDYV